MMVLLARLVLAWVFGLAGITKLADRQGVRDSIVQFGLPVGLAAPIAGILVVYELGLAVGLLYGPSAGVSALAALVLLVGFSVAVALNLMRGRHPDCHCFGRFHSAPVGWSTEGRNALLGCIAAFVVAEGRLPWLFAGLGILAASLWAGLRPRRRRELRVGDAAPGFSLLDQEGRVWTLDTLQAQQEPLIVVFVNLTCRACRALLSDVARWQQDLAGRGAVAVVSGSLHEESVLDEARKCGLRWLLADASRKVSAAYQVAAPPSAVLIDGDRRIAAAPALGAEEIAALIAQVANAREAPQLARRVNRSPSYAGASAGG